MRSKTSIFATYAFLALVGAGGFMWTAKTGETLNTAEAFMAFFGFFSTTVVFYMLGTQKQSIDTCFDAVNENKRSHISEMGDIYRYIDSEMIALARRSDELQGEICRTNDKMVESGCCKTK
jgi:predicted protein tyrosine phosphatase